MQHAETCFKQLFDLKVTQTPKNNFMHSVCILTACYRACCNWCCG